MKKNKGYTMIEMIIVIAIIAILSGMAAISVNLIYKAKVKDGLQTFDSQLSNTWLRTKSTSIKCNSMYAVIEWNENGLAYSVYDVDDEGNVKLKDGVDTSQSEYTPNIKKWTTKAEWKAVKLSYKPSDTSQEETGYGDASKKWYIKFDKSTGGVIKGAGEYVFTAIDGTIAGRIYLDATTGNHFSVNYDNKAADDSKYFIKKR